MKSAVGKPNSSELIPQGAEGLVQTVPCRGLTEGGSIRPFLTNPVNAQVTTFRSGMRRVCCPLAFHHNESGKVTCRDVWGAPCIYAWEDTKTMAV